MPHNNMLLSVLQENNFAFCLLSVVTTPSISCPAINFDFINITVTTEESG